MATVPTSPSGLLYASLIRRIDAEVAALAGKVWLVKAPAIKPPPYALMIPIGGEEGQVQSGPNGLHRKVVQFMAVVPESQGLEAACSLRNSLESIITGRTWQHTIGTKTISLQSIQPAGDGFEDYDSVTAQYMALFRVEIKYQITTAA